MKPLDHVTVLDLSTAQSGRFCARLLAAFGAKVYRPNGLNPRLPELQEADRFIAETLAKAEDVFLDAGKIALQPDLQGEALARACQAVDVVVETFAPGELLRRGVDPQALIATGKTVVSITPFGQDGPRADWAASELTMQAYSGFLHLSGYPEREPVRAALDQMHLTAGRVGAAAAMAALFASSRWGAGQLVDVAVAEVAASLPPFHIQQYTHTGSVAGRGPRLEPALDGRHLPTADGHICFATAGSAPFEMFSLLLEDERLLDERFRTPGGRQRHAQELNTIIEPHVRTRPKYKLFERARELRIVVGMVQTIEDLLECRHLRERDFFTPAETPHGRLRIPGLGIKVDTFGPLNCRFVTSDESELPASKARGASGSSATGMIARQAPLAGVRIVAIEDFLMLPWATVQLANLGADVIHVEPRHGAHVRAMGVYPYNRPNANFWNENAAYSSFERNKACITMDLATPEGHEAFLRLAATADIVMENNRPGAMERLGLGYETLSADHPDLVMVRSSGYGQFGPYRDAGAFARTIDAMSGLTALTGYHQDEPLRANPSFMDMMGAWNNVYAAMLGLLHRQRYGEGVVIDVSMYESGVSAVGVAIVAAQLGLHLERQGNWDPAVAPQGVYPCLGAHRYLAITVRDDAEWARLAAEINEPWVRDERLAKVAHRRTVREWLDQRLAEWAKDQDGFALERRLQALRIPASVVRDARDLVQDEQLLARDFFQWVKTASLEGDYVTPHPSLPFHLDGHRISDVAVSPMGAENARVLKELGYDDATIGEMREQNIIGERPVESVVRPPQPANLALQKQVGAVTDIDEAYEAVIAALRKRRRP